jgi:hypothetical protein
VRKVNHGFSQKLVIANNITETDSTVWGPPDIATSRAMIEPEVTPSNEALIRTHHPSLSAVPFVYSSQEMSGKVFWQVLISGDLTIPDTHAAGREIHIVTPYYHSPDPSKSIIPRLCKIPRLIYPRRMLTVDDISILRNYYPTSIGIRILIAGFAIFLFRNKMDMETAWKSGWPDDIGGLHVGFDILTIKTTSVISGHGAATSLE